MKNRPNAQDRLKVIYVGAKSETVLIKALAYFGVLMDNGNGGFRKGEGIEIIMPYKRILSEAVYEDVGEADEDGLFEVNEVSPASISQSYSVTIAVNLDYIFRFKQKGEDLVNTPDDALEFFQNNGEMIVVDESPAVGIKFPSTLKNPNIWLFVDKPAGAYTLAGLDE